MPHKNKEDERLYQRQRRAAFRAQRILKDGKWYHPNAPHGTNDAYNTYGCRCDKCRNGYSRDRRKLKGYES